MDLEVEFLHCAVSKQVYKRNVGIIEIKLFICSLEFEAQLSLTLM